MKVAVSRMKDGHKVMCRNSTGENKSWSKSYRQ